MLYLSDHYLHIATQYNIEKGDMFEVIHLF